MVEVFCQKVGTPSTRNWRQSKRHQKHIFLEYKKIPKYRRKYATYCQMFYHYITQKYKPHRTILMAGGKLISFPGDFSTRNVYITTEKLIFNSTISTKGQWFLWCDIKTSTWVYQCKYMSTSRYEQPGSRRNHSTICIKGSGTQWVHIYRNKLRHVRPNTIRTNRKLLLFKILSTR